MPACVTCGRSLLPGTTPVDEPAPFWSCETCRTLFAVCFFCREPSAAVTDNGRRRCRSAGCRAFQADARRCGNCNRWSVLETTVVSPHLPNLCQNPNCTVDAIPSTIPPRVGSDGVELHETPPHNSFDLPEPPDPRPPLPLDELLQRIAAQSHFEERYELREQVLRGGMGLIWQAFDRLLGREVAIKMQANPHAGPAAQGQFLKEARVGSRLLHPNVLPVFDLGVNLRGQIYFTMRLVRGASLRNSLDAVATGCATHLVAFPLVQAVRAFRDACRGVDYAHGHGVLHLDLKPENVLVSNFQEVFVIDWGLARVDDQDDTRRLLDLYGGHHDPASTCAAGGVVGTPSYMAPEQARGEHHHFGPATDVYGLGGILHYVLYGKPPNDSPSADVWDMIRELREGTAPPKRPPLRDGILPRGRRVPKETRESLDGLEAICLKCLSRDPAGRYACADDLLIDVNEWLGRAGA